MVICQPSNPFTVLRGISEWTGSSAMPSYSSIFESSYDMEALRFSPSLTQRTDKDVQDVLLILIFVSVFSLPTFPVQFMSEAHLLIQTPELSVLCLTGFGRWIFSGRVPFPALTGPQALCSV